jgi:hypothetical protein
MYIGAWQEFKLAKILQIKDRVDKEQQQSEQLVYEQTKSHKAHSHSNNRAGYQYFADNKSTSIYSQQQPV